MLNPQFCPFDEMGNWLVNCKGSKIHLILSDMSWAGLDPYISLLFLWIFIGCDKNTAIFNTELSEENTYLYSHIFLFCIQPQYLTGVHVSIISYQKCLCYVAHR